MATSGTVLGTTLSNEGSYVNWQLVSQNVAGNYSTINWQAGWRYPALTCRGLRLGSAVINGSTVWNNTAGGDGVHAFNSAHLTSGGQHSPLLQTASGQMNIAHNSDGTYTFGISVAITGWEGGGPNFHSNGSGSFALPTIDRVSAAPSTPVISDITQTTLTVSYTDGGGGAPIDNRYLLYGTDPTGVSVTTVHANGPYSLTGLTPGTTYYFWGYTHNVAGNSPTSARASAMTIAGARVNDGGVWKQAIPYVKDGGVWKVARPWARDLGVWKEAQ